MRVVTSCLMPNHWHLILGPVWGGRLSRFMPWLNTAEVRRRNARHGCEAKRCVVDQHRPAGAP